MDLAVIVSGVVFGLIAACIARQKGRGEVRWFLLGLFFHLLALIVLFLPPVYKPGITKKCPECAEIVKAEANVCRYCGTGFIVADEAEVREVS